MSTEPASNSSHPPTTGRYRVSAMLADAGLHAHWLVLRASAGVALAAGGALALLLPDWRPGVALGAAGLFSTAFLGSLVLVAMGLGSVPADKAFAEEVALARRNARRKVALLAIGAKIVLFLLGGIAAFAVAGYIFRAQRAAELAGVPASSLPSYGLTIVLPALAGIHVLPATAWVYWMARRLSLAGLNSRRAAVAAAGPVGAKAGK